MSSPPPKFAGKLLPMRSDLIPLISSVLAGTKIVKLSPFSLRTIYIFPPPNCPVFSGSNNITN